MALVGTESSAGAAVASAIAGLSETQKQNVPLVWQTIFSALFPHLVAHIATNPGQVTSGGPTTQTVVTPGTIS